MERSSKSAMGETLTGREDVVFEAAGGEHSGNECKRPR